MQCIHPDCYDLLPISILGVGFGSGNPGVQISTTSNSPYEFSLPNAAMMVPSKRAKRVLAKGQTHNWHERLVIRQNSISIKN